MMLARLRYRPRHVPGAAFAPFGEAGALYPLSLVTQLAAALAEAGAFEVEVTRCAASSAALLYPAAFATAQARFPALQERP